MRSRLALTLSSALALLSPAQQTTHSSPQIPILSVCEVFHDLPRYNNRILLVVGVKRSSLEWGVLTQSCPQKHPWGDAIDITGPHPPAEKPAPDLPNSFNWDHNTVLDRKIDDAVKSTKLGPEHNFQGFDYSDRYTIIYGRLETKITRDTKLTGALPAELGYGHLNGAPARLVYTRANPRQFQP